MTLAGHFGCSVSLDLGSQFGASVELQCFQFIMPPPEFRLMRNETPLQPWQLANTDMYDLQHPPSVDEWVRDGHVFTNDLCHRRDVMTCGVLCQGLRMETRGLALTFILTVWPREITVRTRRSDLISL